MYNSWPMLCISWCTSFSLEFMKKLCVWKMTSFLVCKFSLLQTYFSSPNLDILWSSYFLFPSVHNIFFRFFLHKKRLPVFHSPHDVCAKNSTVTRNAIFHCMRWAYYSTLSFFFRGWLITSEQTEIADSFLSFWYRWIYEGMSINSTDSEDITHISKVNKLYKSDFVSKPAHQDRTQKFFKIPAPVC